MYILLGFQIIKNFRFYKGRFFFVKALVTIKRSFQKDVHKNFMRFSSQLVTKIDILTCVHLLIQVIHKNN